MTAPSRAWEGNMRNYNSYVQNADFQGGTALDALQGAGRVLRVAPGGIPPLPSRYGRGLNNPPRYSYGNYGGYGYGGNGYGFGGYGGSYGGYLGGMRNHEFENRYVQLAEESAAPAFESIESFVRGFTSVTMMLDSTYQAMHMSFRAVLGVAENMSRMRQAIFEFLSALTLFKTIYYFYRKILHFLGLVNGADITWREAERALGSGVPAVGSGPATVRSTPKWPMLAFLGAIIAGPALVYKYLLPNGLPEEEEIELIAAYDFQAEQPGEMSFARGEHLFCKKSQIYKGWLMAHKGNNAKGYIPYNRVKQILRKPVYPQTAPQPPSEKPPPPQPAETTQKPPVRASSEPRSAPSGQAPPPERPTIASPPAEIPISQPVPPTIMSFVPPVVPVSPRPVVAPSHSQVAAVRPTTHRDPSLQADINDPSDISDAPLR